MKHLKLFTLAVLAALLPACRSIQDSPKQLHVMIERREPIEVVNNSRRVRVEVGDGETRVEIGDLKLACRGYEGYLGSFAASRGWLRVGTLEVRWSPDSTMVQGPKNWQRFDHEARGSYFLDQSGTIGRNVFRDR